MKSLNFFSHLQTNIWLFKMKNRETAKLLIRILFGRTISDCELFKSVIFRKLVSTAVQPAYIERFVYIQIRA